MSALPTLRYEAIFGAIYGCGLRLVEGTRLRARDIDSERHLVHVVKGKGQRDRYVMLPGNLLRILREYYAQDWPNGEWLFPGEALCKPINGTSVQRAARKASVKVGITPVVTARNLRHTFATHLHEQGVDIRTIQMILGHRSIQTTTVYTHLSKEKLQSTESPFDLLPVVP